MSTYIYLECRNHTPALPSTDEVGQHLYDLPRIQHDLANRQDLIAWHDDPASYKHWRDGSGPHPDTSGYFREHTAVFVREHADCVIAVRDEYDGLHPAVEGGTPGTVSVPDPSDDELLAAINTDRREQYRAWGRTVQETHGPAAHPTKVERVDWEPRTSLDQFEPVLVARTRAALKAARGAALAVTT